MTGFTDEEIKSDFKTAWQAIETNPGARPHYYVYPSGLFNSKTISQIEEDGGDEQFIWIWDMSKETKDSTLGRINIGYSTDVIKEIECYKKIYYSIK